MEDGKKMREPQMNTDLHRCASRTGRLTAETQRRGEGESSKVPSSKFQIGRGSGMGMRVACPSVDFRGDGRVNPDKIQVNPTKSG